MKNLIFSFYLRKRYRIKNLCTDRLNIILF